MRGDYELEADFATAVGALRVTICQQLALLAAHHDLDIEGRLELRVKRYYVPRPGR
jgi:hypothetical protein